MDARAQRKARRELVEQLSAERDARGRNKKHRSAFRKLRRKVGAALIETLAPRPSLRETRESDASCERRERSRGRARMGVRASAFSGVCVERETERERESG